VSVVTPPAAPPPPRARARARARARRGLAVALTAPSLRGALIGDLVLTAVRRDLSLLGVGALLVLVSAALSVALQPRTERETAATTATRGADGAQ